MELCGLMIYGIIAIWYAIKGIKPDPNIRDDGPEIWVDDEFWWE